jgi:glycosyltransferase involved in cell wall biosynthesis
VSAETAYEVSDPTRLAANPRVSVLMITYNHAEYLAQAIEGVVSQLCDFPFELIIGEDASIDRTREIALAYQARYPQVIRVVYSMANVGMHANAGRIFERARGEFLAFCEGDDYWCAPDKLARQVELIRDHPEVSIVHADWIRSYCRNGVWRLNPRGSVHGRVPPKFLQGEIFDTWYLPKILRTCTVLLRRQTVRQLANSGLAQREYRFGDSVLNVYTASIGKVAYLPEVVAVYRVSPNSALRSGTAARVAFYKSCLEFDDDARAYFASRRKYGSGYRWEADMALFLWSLRARDVRSALAAIADMFRHFGPIEFVALGWKSVRLRLPIMRKQARTVPAQPQ